MSKITSFDRHNLKLLGAEIELVLKALEAKYGVAFRRGNSRFLYNTATMKLELSVLNAAGVDKTAEENFRRFAPMVGMDAGAFGKTFVSKGYRFTIAGLATGRTKFPILATRADGAKFKFPADAVRAKLAFGGGE